MALAVLWPNQNTGADNDPARAGPRLMGKMGAGMDACCTVCGKRKETTGMPPETFLTTPAEESQPYSSPAATSEKLSSISFAVLG